MTRVTLGSRAFAPTALLLAAALFPGAAVATDAAQKGFEIAARSDRSDLGFGDSEVEAQMVLRNAAGASTERDLSFKTLEKPNEEVGDKSIVVFSAPRDIRSTALLNHAKMIESDDQWLYLPALKRVKRISSANKSGPFVGSEFAFEDLTSQELNKFTYAFVGEEALDGMTVDVVDRFPRYENSGYTRQRAYYDQDIFQLRKVEFFDRKSALLKTLVFDDYRQYADKYWRAHRLAMVNHQTNKETDLVYGDYTFGVGLDAGDFEQGKLKQIR